MANVARASFGDIIGIGFRIISHRAEIMELWGKVAPMIRDAAGMYPEIRKLVDKIVPGLIEEKEPLRTPGETEEGVGTPFSIRWLQESLNKLDNAGVDVDGEYGPQTNTAIRAFQEKHGLEVDGWAGAGTIAKILAELEKL